MRHNYKINHLGRTSSHREAMLSNMATSLIMHKRIFTTVPKAKALRKFVEPIITRSKDDSTNSRRVVFRALQNKQAVTELFQVVSQKVADRPGGYTRILKTGFRQGDNAAMCFIELVDFNENMLKDSSSKKAKTRRSRRKAADKAAEPQAAAGVSTAKKMKEVSEVKPEATEVKAPETDDAIKNDSASQQNEDIAAEAPSDGEEPKA
ncbi:MAG TPA: 50S ribosomal protein L17 [Dysgonamonadaceae bacterium]|jgi:large subunit ribosomal protein L17|nr:50S ribosomal protein L17 [Dysgonamonadaceae bacterium]HPD42687.1 50S ribosomal protein L17 [Dysgonamonadaceae bacterium]HRS40995.1 50S ribosomal protein L17 [Dysgonamonadaceae bacterium]HRU12358.1 50S ribosomal protein L17 [Dysgonamonadaceae bacterium]